MKPTTFVRHKRHIPAWEAHGYSRPAHNEFVYLVRGGAVTGNYYRLLHSASSEGEKERRSRGGHTDFADWSRLKQHGLVESRDTGPRGGARWHATRTGKRWLAKAKETAS